MPPTAHRGRLPKSAPADPVRPLPPWALGPFVRPPTADAILRPDPASTFACPMLGRPVRWEALHAFNPAAIVRGGRIHVLYRAEDDSGTMAIGQHTSRLGMAVSDDGVRFTRSPAPVLFPADDDQRPNEWPGGCEDPRLVEADDGTYVLTYTQWNGHLPRLAVATSGDLLAWQKHGPVFHPDHGDKYLSIESKAGSIVTRLDAAAGRMKAARIDGRYWMYWGEHDVRLAWSTDLIRWRVVEDAAGRAVVVLGRRPGRFDCPLVEAGPPAVLTDAGIVLLYNAKNDGHHDCPDLAEGAYACGQALFDPADPTRLIDRLDVPFFRPERPFERTGQYGAGTTFIEGLVYHRSAWWLYYGCADSLVAAAVWHPTAAPSPE